jgi:hypothetical protein
LVGTFGTLDFTLMIGDIDNQQEYTFMIMVKEIPLKEKNL